MSYYYGHNVLVSSLNKGASPTLRWPRAQGINLSRLQLKDAYHFQNYLHRERQYLVFKWRAIMVAFSKVPNTMHDFSLK